MYIIVFTLIYWILLALKKWFKLNLKIKNIKLGIYSIVIILSIIELVFILTGFQSTYLEKRNKFYYHSPYSDYGLTRYHVWESDHLLKTKDFSYERNINSLGLSDIEPKIEKSENEYRIIALGDSFTEGDGCHADSTWLKFLERDLEKLETEKTFTFINAGVCGSDPMFEYVLFKDKLLKYKADLLILMINESDFYDIILLGGMERFREDGSIKTKKAPWFEPIYAISRISRLVFRFLGYNELLIKLPIEGTEFQEVEKSIYNVILDFEKLSKENNFKFIVSINPVLSELKNKKLLMHNLSLKLAENKDIIYVDLLKHFIETVDNNDFESLFWKNDGHNNAKGYEVIGKGMFNELKVCKVESL
ncbi:MAG: hypothetical protein GX969_08595 [Firmicutes bacterium]|nr:hypothetical protein [Bacillota bacterium]